MNVKLGIIQPQMQMKRAQWVTGFPEDVSLEVGCQLPYFGGRGLREEKHPENCASDWLANHNNHPKIKRTEEKSPFALGTLSD